jgi:hypothetical protein
MAILLIGAANWLYRLFGACDFVASFTMCHRLCSTNLLVLLKIVEKIQYIPTRTLFRSLLTLLTSAAKICSTCMGISLRYILFYISPGFPITIYSFSHSSYNYIYRWLSKIQNVFIQYKSHIQYVFRRYNMS